MSSIHSFYSSVLFLCCFISVYFNFFYGILWGTSEMNTQEFDVFQQVTSQGSERVYGLNRNHLRSKFTSSVLLWPLCLPNVLARESIRHLFFLAYYLDFCGFALLTPWSFRKKEKSHGKDDVFLGLSDDLTFLDDKLNAGIEKLSHTRWK